MGAKKKVASKTDTLAALTPSREPSNIDFGFTVTGNMELDFPEGMKKYGKNSKNCGNTLKRYLK